MLLTVHRLLVKTRKLPIRLPIRPRDLKATVNFVKSLTVTIEVADSFSAPNFDNIFVSRTIIAISFPTVLVTAEACRR